MLYVPWRNKNADLLNTEINIKDKFCNLIDNIRTESKKFNKLGEDDVLDRLLNAFKDVTADQSINDEDIRSYSDPLEGFEYENEEENNENDCNFLDILPDSVSSTAVDEIIITQPSVLNREEVLSLIRILNSDQRNFILHVGYFFSNKNVDTSLLYFFINGGAGVGKSLLIKVLYQYLLVYHFNRIPGSNPDHIKIILSAFTGKAVYGIGGQTVHSVFGYLYHNADILCLNCQL